LSAVRSSVTEDLKNGARGSTSGGNRRAQSTLLISETALTVVLLACAGLLLRSFQNALRADPGFNPHGVILFDLSVSNAKAPETTDKVQLDHRLIERLRAVPGVTQVAIASSVPMNGNNNLGDLISREDRPLTRNDSEAGFDGIDGDFFPAMQIPLLRGRYLDYRDDEPNAPKVLVVNDDLAKQFFGSEDPLGRQLHFKDAVWTIVGVVGSVRRYQLDFRATPQIYFSPTYFPWRTTVVIRTSGPTALIAAALRQAVREVDSEIPIASLHTLQSSVDDTLRFRRVILVLLGVFGIIALALACIGIYGVISYSAAQRTREIGIRVALGASARQVLALILKQSTVLVAAGIILGLGASLGAGSLIANQLYDVSRADPVVLASVSLLLLAVGAFASWAPAFRATRVNPTTALRSE
jgi:predicted permease